MSLGMWCLLLPFWEIWKAINSHQFENDDIKPDQIVLKSINFAKEIFNAFKNNLVDSSKKNHGIIK